MGNSDYEGLRKKKTPKKNVKDSFCKIIIAQFTACAFITGMIAAVVKLGAGDELKIKYSSAMGSNIGISDVISSAKDVVSSVMKPVETEETKQEEIIEAKTDDVQINTEQAPVQEKSEEETYEKSDERTVAQVMSIFGDDESITVPAHGKISSGFGYRTDPISGEKKLHSALDIAVDEGTNVGAAWNGIVTKAGYDETAGNYVWMVHKNGCETLYCHCSKLTVKKGDVIRAGETVAISGSTGYSTGPHLHFGIRKNGSMVDPSEYVTVKNGRI